jgi:hypothetical protein
MRHNLPCLLLLAGVAAAQPPYELILKSGRAAADWQTAGLPRPSRGKPAGALK